MCLQTCERYFEVIFVVFDFFSKLKFAFFCSKNSYCFYAAILFLLLVEYEPIADWYTASISTN